MVSYRNSNKSATYSDVPIPLLVACLSGEPDGWEMGVHGKQPVRRVGADALDSFQDAAAKTDWRSRNPIEKQDADALLKTIAIGENLMRKRGVRTIVEQLPIYVPPSKLKTDQLTEAELVLEFCKSVGLGIANSRLVVWWSRWEKRFALGIHCGQVPMRSLYLLAFARLGQPGGLAPCQNCGKFFRRGHKKEKRFCNSNCRSAFTMRKLRAKAKRNRQRKGVSKEVQLVTRKAR
jgi:hypothetical protein